MARAQVLYWRDIPAQVRVETDHDEVTVEIEGAVPRIDALAMRLGLQGTDEYLELWKWSDPEERPGSPREVAEALKRELHSRVDDAG